MSRHSIESGYVSDEEKTFTSEQIIKKDAKRFEKNFSIEEELVKSANGVIYSGFELTTGEPVIFKQIPKTSNERLISHEGRKIPSEIYYHLKAAEASEAVVQPIDFFERKTSYVLVMEKLENVTDLYEFVGEMERLSEEAALFIFQQVVQAISELSAAGISHRDIKDENILVNRETLQVFLIDFGCSSSTGVCSSPCGTPEYWAPEVFDQFEVESEITDCWALGAVLYIMLTGSWKFENKRLTRNFVLEQQLSESIVAILDRLFHESPACRPSLTDLINLF
jgi:serine/threonine protein kinase